MVKSREISEIENVSSGFRIWPEVDLLLCNGRLQRSIRLSPSIIYKLHEAYKSKYQFRDLPCHISHEIHKLFILVRYFRYILIHGSPWKTESIIWKIKPWDNENSKTCKNHCWEQNRPLLDLLGIISITSTHDNKKTISEIYFSEIIELGKYTNALLMILNLNLEQDLKRARRINFCESH